MASATVSVANNTQMHRVEFGGFDGVGELFVNPTLTHIATKNRAQVTP